MLGNFEEQVLLKITDPVVLNKHATITVPMHYKAFLSVDNKVLCRVNPCSDAKVKDLIDGKVFKENLGNQVSVILVSSNTSSMMAGWGFGNIQVNNERLKEAYRAGANGKFSVDIIDPIALMRAFPGSTTITLEQVRSVVSTLFHSTGTPLLAKYFANTNISVFEISSCIQEFRDKFYEAVKNEEMFAKLGLKLTVLSVNGIHVNEDDLELIRERING